MRSLIFSVAYWMFSILYVLVTLPALILPGDTVVRALILSYVKSMRWSLRVFAGIRHEIRGRDNLPDGPFVIAAKHQSWGDGYLIYPEIESIAFVTGDHLEKFPFVGKILQKLGAIVIDTCGGGERKAASLAEGLERIREDGRRVLIYPEGHLAPVDYHFRYKAGVWHMANGMKVPVVPVATNIGLYWSQEDHQKKPGMAVVEFLPPMEAGENKSAFMSELTHTIETATARLVAEGRNTAVKPTVLIPDPAKGEVANPVSGHVS